MLLHPGELDLQVVDRQARLRPRRIPRAANHRGLRVRLGKALIAVGTALAGPERARHAPTRPAKPAHQHS